MGKLANNLELEQAESVKGAAGVEDSVKVEHSVRDFYDSYGWVDVEGENGENRSFRQFGPGYPEYHKGVEQRTLAEFQPAIGRLLIAGGGDLPESHIKLAQQYSEVCCVDISKEALRISQQKLSGRANLIESSILDMPIEDGRFDAVFCAHVIYHINREQQAHAIRELLRVTRPGGKVVVIYSNPRSPLRFLAGAVHKLSARLRQSESQARPELYFFAHKLAWWQQFRTQAEVELKPWDVIGSYEHRTLIRSDFGSRTLYSFAEWLENKAPSLATYLWQYSLVALTREETLADAREETRTTGKETGA